MDDTSVSGEVAQPIAEQAPPAQPMLSQEQVNRIVAREKQRAADNARRDAEQRYQQELEQLNAQRQQQEQRNAEVPRDIDANVIYQQVQERFNQEMQKRQLDEQMAQVANNYLQKVALAKNNYTDFDDVTKDFDPTAFPQLTFLLSGIENAGDILYDLSKNPMKLAAIDRLSEKNPKQAHSELLKLSQSIASNQQAMTESANQYVQEPLDRMQPSRIAGSNGKMSISDLRRMPWLRK